jgi:hypothetical protein
MMSSTQSTRWVGWIGFAGVILLLNGLFSLLEALVALFAPSGYFNVTRFGLFVMSVNGHGWWNLIAAVLFIATAAALLGGATWARVVAVILAALSAIEQLLLIPAQPWWSFIVIAIDVLIIYAVTAHGREISS